MGGDEIGMMEDKENEGEVEKEEGGGAHGLLEML